MMSRDELRAKLKDAQDRLECACDTSNNADRIRAIIYEIEMLEDQIANYPPPWCKPYPYKMTEGCTGCLRRKDQMEKGYSVCRYEGPDTIIVCRHCHPMGPSYELADSVKKER